MAGADDDDDDGESPSALPEDIYSSEFDLCDFVRRRLSILPEEDSSMEEEAEQESFAAARSFTLDSAPQHRFAQLAKEARTRALRVSKSSSNLRRSTPV